MREALQSSPPGPPPDGGRHIGPDRRTDDGALEQRKLIARARRRTKAAAIQQSALSRDRPSRRRARRTYKDRSKTIKVTTRNGYSVEGRRNIQCECSLES